MTASRTVPVTVPLDLRTTLTGAGKLFGRFTSDGWWRPMRTPEGPVTLRVGRSDAGVEASAWGPGAAWALDRVPGLIGLLDEREEFASGHPVVGEIAKVNPGWRLAQTGLVYEALVWAIVSQKITGKEAARSLRALMVGFSDPAPGPRPGLRLPPDPERLAVAPYWALHPLGIERRRADTLRRAASEASRLDRLADIDSLEVQRYLRRLPGVGVWTVAETVAVSHGDPDAVSVGDYHIKNTVSWHLAGEPRGTDERMLELLEPFRPHRGRVIRFLESLGPAPRYGPRQALPTHL